MRVELGGLTIHGTEVQATADEVQRSLRILSQRFRPTDLDETDRTPEGRIASLNFQKLPFGRSDAEQESHSGCTIVHCRTMPLFEGCAFAIDRVHQPIGAGTNPRASCFPPTFGLNRPSTPPYGFITRVLRNLHTQFPQQCPDV